MWESIKFWVPVLKDFFGANWVWLIISIGATVWLWVQSEKPENIINPAWKKWFWSVLAITIISNTYFFYDSYSEHANTEVQTPRATLKY